MTKILVVEDAKELRDDILEMLSLEGFTALGAENGLEGIQFAQAEQPDLIICDVMMPEKDGYEVLEALRKDPATASIPFVFLTAKTERANLRQGMSLGAEDYLTKPFLVTELLETIHSQLRKRNMFTKIVNNLLDELRINITTALPHELRTPLNTILGFSSILMGESRNLDPDQVADYAQHINIAANRMERMVEKYIAYVRISISSDSQEHLVAFQKERLNGIDSIVQQQAMHTAMRCKREQDLQVEMTAVDEVQMGYQDMLKIIDELLDNAFKFSEKNSIVRVVGTVAHNYYRIMITDQGRGITREQVYKIGAFMQFDRWYFEQQGLGLGLAIVDRLIKIYDGKFSIGGLPEGGTQAIVLLRIP